jgi:cell division transport system permease protein
MRFRILGSEAWRSLAANASTTIAATMTVLIGMFLLGLSLALGTWAYSYAHHVKGEIVVKVFFCTPLTCGTEATRAQEQHVGNFIGALPSVKHIEFVSKEKAIKTEAKKHPDLYNQLPSNPLPDRFDVIPKRAEDVDRIAAAVPGREAGVEKVDFGRRKAHAVLRATAAIEAVVGAFIIVLLIASALLIANTIRLSIFSRRREIEVMKLVGATNWFVRGPFMLEGVICGLAGAAIAVVLLVLGKEIVMPAILGHITASEDAHAWPFPLICLVLLGFGLMLGAAGSGVTIRRFLKV